MARNFKKMFKKIIRKYFFTIFLFIFLSFLPVRALLSKFILRVLSNYL